MWKKALSYYLFFITSISAIILGACNQENDCLDYSSNKGDIIREIDLGECYGILTEPYVLVTDTISYKKLATITNDSVISQMGCGATPALPDIDFETHSLAGVLTSGIGCVVTYEREVSIDTLKKTVDYIIKVHECGNCNDKRFNMNWVLIHKVDSTYSLQPIIMQK